MNKVLFFGFLGLVTPLLSQIGPGTWQDHLSINSCNSVTRNGTTLYASYYNGIIKFNEEELSPVPLNKINGLSDIGVRLLRTNPYNKKVLVVYDNCNIDIIDKDENIVNYPSIKLKSLSGKKTINEVTFDKQYAYLACGFGIVVFDTDKLEVRDTYIIGPNASNIEVNQLAIQDSLIFAATPTGIFRANRNTLLNNYQNWRHDTITIPAGPYCGVQNVNGKIISIYSPSSINRADEGKDTIYTLANNIWIKYPPMASGGHTIRKMGPTYENLFSYMDPIGFQVRDVNDGVLKQYLMDYNGDFDYETCQDAYIGKDFSGNISYWVADKRFGLNQRYQYYDPPKKITRNGMSKNRIGNIDIFKGKVAVSPSNIPYTGNGNFLLEGVNILQNYDWSYLSCNDDNNKPVMDVTSVLWDRKDTSVLWVSSWFYGVMKYKNKELIKPSYTGSNTAMPLVTANEPRCAGLSMDKAGNVWFASSDQKNYLNVIKKEGVLQNFIFSVSRGFCRKTFVDRNDQVWVLHESNGGITVVKHNNFTTPQYSFLTAEVGSGNLQANSVYSIAEDLDGKIWIGTSEGISVIYNPGAIFNGGDFDAQPIKIVQDGNVELLLGKEIVTAICIDGANNKWCGTTSGGVYCFSPDGLTQLHHFTVENSPLYSNTIIDIKYDEVTGDLFFGTEMGLQSFRGIVVAGEEVHSEIYAYPNPVKPGYQGNVLIRGLMDGAIVKITDVSGNMVWETKAKGGQIAWPVATLSGSRVTSGVYVVYASTIMGEYRALTKILVVN